MNRILVSLIAFFWATNLIGQTVSFPFKNDSSLIRIREYYSNYGKIFNNEQNAVLSSIKIKDNFKPSVEDIIMAEKLMEKKYSDLIKSDERTKSLIGTEYKGHYNKFYRQYIGIEDDIGDKIIFIQLFKCCKKNINKCFPDWKEKLINQLDEDICTITIAFIVNLTQRKITIN
jgi:hypothetical protein